MCIYDQPTPVFIAQPLNGRFTLAPANHLPPQSSAKALLASGKAKKRR